MWSGSAERHAANPDDKLLPPVSEMVETSKRLRCRARPPLWRLCAVGRHRRQACSGLPWGSASSALAGLDTGGCDRPAAGRGRRTWHTRRRALDDPADGRSADPVHRVRPRRVLEGRADRHRRRADHDSRHLARGRGHAARAADQGADAGRLDLAGRDPRGAAADHAAPDRGAAADRSGRRSCSSFRRRRSRPTSVLATASSWFAAIWRWT